MEGVAAKLVGVRPAAYHKVWDDRKTGSKPHHVSFWRPVPPRGFHRVSDLAQRTHEKEPAQMARCLVVAAHGSVADGSSPVLRPPVDYTCVWTDKRSGGRYGNCSLWVPVAPEGYCALGCVAVVGYEKPGLNEVMCVHSSLCTPAGVVSEDPTGPLWKDAGSGSVNDVSIWTMAPLEIGEGISIDSFLAVPHHGTKVNPAHPFAFCGLYCISTSAIIIETPQSPLVAAIAAAAASATATTAASSAVSTSTSASMCTFGGFASALASLAAPATAPLLPFGVDPATLPLERDDATGLTVPRGLVALRRLFYAMNGHMEEGIFRIAGSETECQKMQASLNKPRNVDKQGNFSFDVFPNDVHAVSSLIKRWYRELPVRLLAGSAACVADLSGRLAAADDRAVLLEEIRGFPDSLPPLQKDLFLFLMGLGRDVARNSAVNKMVPRNIAVVFAPMLVERTSPMEEMMRTSEIMLFLVACLELPEP
ncbi:RhoGAP domain containing protein [Acanthamoeba castellanii str. Neff]|uniref:RhoGAP domain containing protein n=1 Tax=Acanthamoeba castellanii (strain ATCC 30010 / Neff) TaxID=1257118 RepID=L8HB62_ACACF|nr:RhoGAP domain containing protein [Acanthamoeba castellanii str. Neff]ELR22450.1 RhoGAP domain containing protein [Acanthamoeba castellanii str. Neff]